MLARGIEPGHFADTPTGRECARIYAWSIEHLKRHNVTPSPAFVKERWPDWAPEPAADPLEALIDAFVKNLNRRVYASHITELFHAGNDPANWERLPEIMMEHAREMSALISTTRAAKLSEMDQRIVAYEEEAALGKPPGFDIGIPEFDYMIGGLRPGNVIVLSGYLGTGKSTLASWITLNIVEQGYSALFIPLEMTRHDVFERIDTMIVHFSHRLLRNRQLPEQDVEVWRRIARQFRNLQKDLTVIDGVGAFTVDKLIAEVHKHKPDFTVIDYVQLMKTSSNDRSRTHWEKLTEINNECKQIALATESVVMLVSQDNRDAAETGSTLSTMGGSISVGQVGDVYIGMRQTDEMRAMNRMEVKLLKIRNGARDKPVLLDWDPSHMRFGPAGEGAAGYPRKEINAPTGS
jgi:replicative DNA helicase